MSARATVPAAAQIHTDRRRPNLIPMPRIRVEFDYVNWNDEYHHYVIDVESIEFTEYGAARGPDDGDVWILSGATVTRDWDTRPDMGSRRRSFIMGEMRNLEVVA